MQTTCPECQTTFRVTQSQLDARRGLVRCGRCNAVFNAFDRLRLELDAPPASAGPDVHRAPVAPNAQEGVDSAPADPALPYAQTVQATTIPKPAASAKRPASPARPASVARSESDAILLSSLSASRKDITSIWRALALSLIGLILALLLPMQTVYFLRAEIVAWQPSLRPWFERACRRLGCDLPIARQIDAIKIEASALEIDAEQPAHARLRVTFSNRSGLLQAWPYFLLKLTDTAGQPLAQRAFAPHDYLPADRRGTPGIPPRSELEFQLDLHLSALAAAGYEVRPHYP